MIQHSKSMQKRRVETD